MTKSKTEAKPKVEKKEIAKIEPEKTEVKEMAVIDDQPLVPAEYKSKLTRQQTELIKNTIAKGASDDELKMFLYVCERTRLDPFTKQIHLVPRWDGRLGKEVRTPIVGIDGLRSVAERTGSYAGNDDPTFDDEAKPTKATVTVYKIVQGIRVGFTASARWEQYVPMSKDKKTGAPYISSPLWNKMPHLMLGKCAEALALRKAFPAVMSGLYVAEELAHVQPGAPQQATGGHGGGVESDFDKAIRMIKATVDADGLLAMKSKIEASEKYTNAEINKISKAIDARVKELAPTLVDEDEKNLL